MVEQVWTLESGVEAPQFPLCFYAQRGVVEFAVEGSESLQPRTTHQTHSRMLDPTILLNDFDVPTKHRHRLVREKDQDPHQLQQAQTQSRRIRFSYKFLSNTSRDPEFHLLCQGRIKEYAEAWGDQIPVVHIGHRPPPHFCSNGESSASSGR
ncbi:hypothetical protein H6P81_007323 [Aristolochia fimbriata]|uniref:Uncharacterized protein n=1 Tax=Aristolochia fimbriata TaxID=158543 RepID=A0AAV7F163_ARIFI|nr:hypothetical protein H6P81_007323 [Aristolochia fimbriata]